MPIGEEINDAGYEPAALSWYTFIRILHDRYLDMLLKENALQ